MIKSIRNKALRTYWKTGSTKGLNSDWFPKLRLILDALEAAAYPDDMNYPGANFHSLKGNLHGYFSVRLTGNFRIIFKFEEEGFTLIDIVDYH